MCICDTATLYGLISSHSCGLFKKKTFFVSPGENGSVRAIIQRHGGTLVSTVRPSTSFYVLSYATEGDSPSLVLARRQAVPLIPACYLRACVQHRAILPVTEHALDLHSIATHNLYCGLWNQSHTSNFMAIFSVPRDEWREEEEQPQCFQEFVEMDDRLVSIPAVKDAIYVMNLRDKNSTAVRSRFHAVLLEYLEIYFGLSIKPWNNDILLNLTSSSCTFEVNRKRHRIRTNLNSAAIDPMDLIDRLIPHIPHDGVVLLVLCHDFSLHEDGHEVYGRATGDGVCCVAMPSDPINDAAATGILRHLLGVMSHELMHCFGIDHCAYFGCVMNACCDADQTQVEENPPLALCTIDLRKLHHSLQFNARKRFYDLLTFYQKHNLNKDAAFISQTLACLP